MNAPLSKSKLLAFRQCPRRLWLEVHRPDLSYDRLDGVQDGGMAMEAFLEAINPQTTPAARPRSSSNCCARYTGPGAFVGAVYQPDGGHWRRGGNATSELNDPTDALPRVTMMG